LFAFFHKASPVNLEGFEGNFFLLPIDNVKASAKTLSSYFVVFAYIAYNLAQS
jgi:hypothetical protein